MKKMAARDFEDILQVSFAPSIVCILTVPHGAIFKLYFQCALPVFTGLFPEPHNSKIMALIFTLGHWHGLAKLQMHTDETLKALDKVTKHLAASLHRFVEDVCPAFSTRELRREAKSRKRQQARHANSGSHTSAQHPGTTDRCPKVLNLRTYKLHALSNYVSQMKLFGTTDSYSTQAVCIFFTFSLIGPDTLFTSCWC